MLTNTRFVWPARVLAGLSLGAFLFLACGGGVTDPDAGKGPPVVVVDNVLLIDGTGAPPTRSRVVWSGSVIRGVGDDVEIPDSAELELIDGEGLVLAPGFIDTHSHADSDLEERLDALAAVSQGITTVVVGQDGGSRTPLNDWFSLFEGDPSTVNVASYVGHGTIRRAVLGDDFRRPATALELEKMSSLLVADLEAGALGLSTGLEYDPGIYSGAEEVLALAKTAAGHGGRYISHMRSEDRHLWEALDELLRIGRETGMPVQVSHAKLAMASLWGEADRFIEVLERARASGIDVSLDVYPYPYWQSTLTVMFPDRDFDNPESARFAVSELSTPEGMLIPVFAPAPELAGKTLAEISTLRQTDSARTLMDLIDESLRFAAANPDHGRVESVIATSMDQRDIDRLIAWEHANICSDGALMGAHPRGFGAFTRVLGDYVRERSVVSLEKAVYKMTGLAADHMGLAGRGRIQVGLAADLVLFDPETVLDRATPQAPHRVSDGIERVWVNGELVFGPDGLGVSRPGKVLRREGAGEPNPSE